jgi:metal-dependent HD superfamily phosphatase/phosphodiesterase
VFVDSRIKANMLKKIAVEQITMGMHIKEFCGSWMEHPFWRSGFVLVDPKDIKTILASSIKEVWIDTNKGADIPSGDVAVSSSEAEAQVEAALEQVSIATREVAPVSMAVEMQRAAKICFQAKQAVGRSRYAEWDPSR